MKVEKLELFRHDFNALSNRQIIRVAFDLKTAIDCYSARFYLDTPATVTYPDEKPVKYYSFPAVDFADADFVYAIDPYVTGNSRAVLNIAAKRGMETVVRQIFNKAAMQIIAHGLALHHKCMESGFFAEQEMPAHKNLCRPSVAQELVDSGKIAFLPFLTPRVGAVA